MDNPPQLSRPTLSLGIGVGGGPSGFGPGPGPNRRKLNLALNNIQPQTQHVDTNRKFQEIMDRTGKLTINGIEYKTDINDLEHDRELGSGTCGQVVKMRHKQTGQYIAVKQMRRTGNTDENKRIIMDLEVVLKSHDCPFIVKCLGCIITDSDVYICMELMSTCMEKLLKDCKAKSYEIPERVIGKIAVATVRALHYLKEQHGVIHRDVKPSNILLDDKGNIKLCDFGIAGHLIDSKAQTRNAGCIAYMAPERIDQSKYDIRADVWSLGITLIELATGETPYSNCDGDFQVLTVIVESDPPTLPPNKKFTPEFRSFVNCCLQKDVSRRPKYKDLLEHDFIKMSAMKAAVDVVGAWYKIMCGARVAPVKGSTGVGLTNIGRHSARNMRLSSASGVGGNSRTDSISNKLSPMTPGAGYGYSGSSISINFQSPSPRTMRSIFDRLNSEPVAHARRSPSTTPDTPGSLLGTPPEPPPRLSRLGSEANNLGGGLRTPTPTNSSGIGSSNSVGSGLLATPSPTTSYSFLNSNYNSTSSPSPLQEQLSSPQQQPQVQQSSMRRLKTLFLCFTCW